MLWLLVPRAVAAMRAGVEDVNVLAKLQFKAKSADLGSMSDHAVIVSDMKEFAANGIKFGFGVCETADPESMLARVTSLQQEMAYVKQATSSCAPQMV